MSDSREHLDPKRLRRNLLRLAEFIRGMDREGTLLNAAPRLLKLMGDLRSQLFEYEVRHTGRLLPKPASAEPEAETIAEGESRQIVQEALERRREAEENWRRGWREEGHG